MAKKSIIVSDLPQTFVEDRHPPRTFSLCLLTMQFRDLSLREMIEIEGAKDYIQGRSCEGCTLCCKVLSITELEKPQGIWCKHADAGRGCRIYGNHPKECLHFHCGYLTWPATAEHWRPSRSKMVIVSELDGGRVGVHVDPGRPSAWREKPFYDDLKQWAVFAARDHKQVVVYVGARVIVIFPDCDVDLGVVSDDDRIITFETRDRSGRRSLDAQKLKVNDPRIQGMVDGRPFRPSNMAEAKSLARRFS